MALRASHGFRRFALSVQYHGSSFLGFAFQGDQENNILPDGTDLRGWRSVEGRLREALTDLCGEGNVENFQVSSRTDRGVHALKNTCHVDVRERNSLRRLWNEVDLLNGINFFLSHQNTTDGIDKRSRKRTAKKNRAGKPSSLMQDCRVLNIVQPPPKMKNIFYDADNSQPQFVDWNARFSATERTYVYRILTMSKNQCYGLPFEWDRSWRIRSQLDISCMNDAAEAFIGTHDFTSFRGTNCQRKSPIVAIHDVQVRSTPHDTSHGWMGEGGGLLGLGTSNNDDEQSPKLVTVKVTGGAFVYRQVRNMVGCLVHVGINQLEPQFVEQLLGARNRAEAPSMAPPHGLFLADVKHGDFKI